MVSLTLEEAHNLEDELEQTLRNKNPSHPALKFYGSTWEAVDGYYKALYGHKLFGEVAKEVIDEEP